MHSLLASVLVHFHIKDFHFYLFEDSEEEVVINKLPIQFDTNSIEQLYPYLNDSYLKDVFDKKIRVQKAYNVFVGQIEAQIFKERDYEKYN